jgi:hypothetical protein
VGTPPGGVAGGRVPSRAVPHSHLWFRIASWPCVWCSGRPPSSFQEAGARPQSADADRPVSSEQHTKVLAGTRRRGRRDSRRPTKGAERGCGRVPGTQHNLGKGGGL